MDKAISKNEYTRIAQDFCSFSRRKKGSIASYVTLFTTQKMDNKDQQVGYILRRKSPKVKKGISLISGWRVLLR